MRKQPLAKGAPAVVRKWRRLMALGCTHGHLTDKSRLDEAMAFRYRFQPEHRVELGDLVDTTAFRSGARDTKDEAEPIEPDKLAGCSWIERYEPTDITWGNHCWRVYNLQSHYSAIVAAAAGAVWKALSDSARKVGARTIPYLPRDKGSFLLGGVRFAHGWDYNAHALRDHSEYFGGRCCIAHLHTPQMLRGRTMFNSSSFCVGTLADIDRLEYASARRNTASWGAGIVFGEVCDEDAMLWLASAQKGQPLHFPPGL